MIHALRKKKQGSFLLLLRLRHITFVCDVVNTGFGVRRSHGRQSSITIWCYCLREFTPCWQTVRRCRHDCRRRQYIFPDRCWLLVFVDDDNNNEKLVQKATCRAVWELVTTKTVFEYLFLSLDTPRKEKKHKKKKKNQTQVAKSAVFEKSRIPFQPSGF